MPTQEIEAARERIRKVKESDNELLHLSYLNLTSEDLDTVWEDIKSIQNLRHLDLSNNELTTLPDNIGDLAGIQTLTLVNNQISVLPESMAALADELTGLQFTGNKPTNETEEWLNATFKNMSGLSIHCVRPEIPGRKRSAPKHESKGAKEIYGNRSAGFLAALPALDRELGTVAIPGEQNPISPGDIIKDFLLNLPVNDALSTVVYNPLARGILDFIGDTGQVTAERHDALVKMDKCLADGETSVRDFLMQSFVEKGLEGKAALPAYELGIVQREAIEQILRQELDSGQQPKEQKWEVQGLLNALFVEGSEENNLNPIRIFGQRPRLPSKTAYPEFAWNQVRDNAAVIAKFTSMICTTGGMGVTVGPGDGYVLDQGKLNAITEQYLSKLGLSHELARQVAHGPERSLSAMTVASNEGQRQAPDAGPAYSRGQGQGQESNQGQNRSRPKSPR